MRHLLARKTAMIGVAALTALAACASGAVTGAATVTGGSVVSGHIDYPLDEGLWFLGECGPTQWSLDLSGFDTAVDPAGTLNVAPISITGSGAPPCGFFGETEIGTVSLSVSSTGLVGDLECPSMSGSYTRKDTAFSMAVSGDCTFNGVLRAGKTLTLSLLGTPTQIGGDVSSINSFSVTGTATW